ncbi:MAG: CvpA family protein [Thermoleophilia bacterium]|nr:CvpA family protein [Thermoleophilia bacterium]
MGGLLIDIAVLLVIAGFGFAGSELGLVRSLIRLVAIVSAAAIAVLLVRPASWVVGFVLPGSDDFARLVSMLGVGAAMFLAIAAMVSWYAEWVPHEKVARLDRAFGAVPGVLIGVLWCSLMVALLVLTPSTTALSRWPVDSVPGKFLVAHAEGQMMWLTETFPHYTQILPKGKHGAVVKRSSHLDFGGTPKLTNSPDDAGNLLANLNDARQRNSSPEFTWNPELADAATHNSQQMFTNRYLGTVTTGGIEFTERMRLVLGGNSNLYCSYGAQVVWAHDVPSAFAALFAEPGIQRKLLSDRFLEIGIGATNGGWFNGTMFTIAMVGERLDPVRISDSGQTCATLHRSGGTSGGSEAIDPLAGTINPSAVARDLSQGDAATS